MADNETPTYPNIVLPNFTGSRLRNAQFAEFVESILEAIGNDAAPLFAENKVPVLERARALFQSYVRFPMSYTETAQIKALDAYRDQLLAAFIAFYKKCVKMPADSALFTAANTLKPVVNCYIDAAGLDITDQNNLVRELLGALALEDNAAAVEALGMSPLITALTATNNSIRFLYRKRAITKGTRLTARDGKTTSDLRNEIVPVLTDLIETVNGAYKLQPTEMTNRIMTELLGVFTQYQDIAARLDGRATSGEDEDETEDEAAGDDADSGGDESAADESGAGESASGSGE